MTTTDPYKLHRLALLPLISKNPQEVFDTVWSAATAMDEKKLLDFILQQGIGPLWSEAITKCESALFSPNFADTMKEARLTAAGQYMWQHHSLKKIDNVFDAKAIPYAVFKGIHIRELIYNKPAVRPACDIDILVARPDKEKAIKSIVSAGYSFLPKEANISHEATLADSHVAIDQHWDIMRPGRTRRDMTDELLATRKKFAGYWGLSDEAALFVMLVHPVFTKYLNSPDGTLIRMVDLARWIELRQTDWDKVYYWLKHAGLLTAAWTTLEWLKILTGITPPAKFIEKIHPGILKTRYLRFWITQDYTNRFVATPIINKIAFTLPVHDTLSDAIRATRSIISAKQASSQLTKGLENSIAESGFLVGRRKTTMDSRLRGRDNKGYDGGS